MITWFSFEHSKDRKLTWPVIFALLFLKFWKLCVSPSLALYFGCRCRFTPTCSTYAVEVLRSKGFILGCFLIFRRILKCNPWSRNQCDCDAI